MLYLAVFPDMVSQNSNYKTLKFSKQPLCLKNICTELWRKLPNLTAFLEIYLYLKKNDSVKHV